MYIIVSYDVNQIRCNKLLKIFRKYLFHVHNSVFEGEITESEYRKLYNEIKKVIDICDDRVIFYKLPSKKVLKTDTINTNNSENIIY